MATVTITPAARAEYAGLPTAIQRRVRAVFQRLANWPAVSGAKPPRGTLHGSYRIRTGDYRVVFTPGTDPKTAVVVVTVWKIGHRGGVYD